MSEAATAPNQNQHHEHHFEIHPRRWLALGSILTASFMVLLDISIVNVAIPAIRNNLRATNADIQWVVAGYGLAYALMLITGGRLGDIYGRKKLFMLGMTGFVLTSALCGGAQSALMLDLSRVAQGLLASMMFPQVLSMIQVMFPPKDRAKAFGILGAIIGLATITGPLAGGLIIRDDLTGDSWRWIFFVNVPIGIASLAVAWRVVSESRAPHASKLDIPGVLLATVGLALLVYPLVEGRDAGWPAWSFVSMALSVPVLLAFVLYERRLPDTKFPLVQLSLFSIQSFRFGSFISALFLLGVPAFWLCFSLTLQVGLGYSALQAGITAIPASLGSALAATMSIRLAPRLGKWLIAGGCLLLVIGTCGVIATLHWRMENLAGPELIPALFVSGLGTGSVIAPLLNIILAGVPPRHAGSASGVLATFQQLGGAVGIAIIGVIFFGFLGVLADNASNSVSGDLKNSLLALHVPAPAADQAVGTFARCFHDRASESDPAVIPPSCQGPAVQSAPAPIKTAFANAAKTALARDFVSTEERNLVFNLVVWSLAGVFALFLPKSTFQAHGAAAPPEVRSAENQPAAV